MTTFHDASLPSYLQPEQAVEPEHLPLQVLLLTHEVANLRTQLNLLANLLIEAGHTISPPAPPHGGLTDVSHG